ncbi:MAG: hypothetical protein ILO42_06165 [Clostridia bacterium]|nr:hypothetical protein [Clostridia bacterium]MBP5270522.1 hypothetical protein [Clostridia bacterium]
MKRILCLALALILSASAILATASCASQGGEGGDDTTLPVATVPDTEEATSEVITEDPDWSYDLPTLNYGGETVRFLVLGQSFAADEFKADDINGQLVNDAVYERNAKIESELGVKLAIDVASSTDVYAVGNSVRTSVKTGSYYYDIVSLPSYTHTSYCLEGDFVNLLGVDNLNLDKHYWTQGFNEIMSNGKRQYIASGAFSVSMIRNMYITLYSKSELRSRNLPDLYTLALNKEWTVGRQLEIIKGTYDDTNGDQRRDAGDFYGFVSGTNTSIDPYWVGWNLPILQVDKSTGLFDIRVDNDRMVGILGKIRELIINNSDTWNKGSGGGDVDGAYSTTALTMFAEGHCAMTTAMIYGIESVLTSSGYQGEYGIVPIPKYDDDQEDYRTHVQDQMSVLAIVSNSPEENRDMLGAVMETIACRSYQSVFPAYYDSALSYRYLQNPESKTMLDMIYDSIKIEGCFIYSASFAFLGQLRTMGSNSASSPSSLVANAVRGLGKKLNDFNDAYGKLKD